ncbi:flhB HrpN YscU SpaS family protein, partial [Vibrio parahaemolyticus V-223/04]
NAG